MKKTYKKQLFNIAFVLALAGVTLTVLYFSSGELNAESLRAFFSECNGWWIAAAVGCMLLFAVFEALALHIILRRLGHRTRFTSSLVYSASDIYYSGITPSATGGQPASAFYMIRDRIHGGTACFALVFNLLCYTTALLLLGIVVLAFNFPMFLAFSPWVKVFLIVGLMSQIFLLGLFLACILRPNAVRRIGNFLVTLLVRIRVIRKEERWRRKVTAAVESYHGCFECFRRQRALFWEVLLCNVLQRASLILVSVFVCRSVVDCSLFETFSMQTFAMLGYNSIPLPGGSGAFEFLYLNIYETVFTAEFTLVAMMVTRVISYYLSMLVSGLYTALYHVLAPSAKVTRIADTAVINGKEGIGDE